MTIKREKPQRTCVGCRKRFDQSDLLAITRLKDGSVIVNKDQNEKGRSVYICQNPVCLKKARGKKGKSALEYGLKVSIPENVWEALEKLVQPKI